MPRFANWLKTLGLAGLLIATAALPPALFSWLQPAASQAAVPTATGTPPALPALSTAQLAGQRVIYSYKGLTPPASLLTLIGHGEAAGVIFFADNIASRPQLRAVVRALEQADQSPHNPVKAPLLLMTDQEGGQVRRLSGAPLLSEKQIGQATDPAAAAGAAGKNAAANLRNVGLNVNLAPVLDVYRQTGDFDDQYGRSYSTDPTIVSTLGAEFIAAQQKAGVAATAKHFPGLGAAGRTQDTDLRRVTLNLPLSSIRDIDELPYEAAIAAQVKLVMVSWALYPALDKKRPAGLSSDIIQGELRKRLGFGGVTITDALEAKALVGFGTVGHRAELAAAAGMDLILCSRGSVSEGQKTLAGLSRGYSDGALNQVTFRASVQRVIALRSSL